MNRLLAQWFGCLRLAGIVNIVHAEGRRGGGCRERSGSSMSKETMLIDDVTDHVIGAAIELHRDAGPGLLESFYEAALALYLERRRLRSRRQAAVRFEFAGKLFDEAFRADLIVEDAVIVEAKSVTKLDPVFARQLRTCLKLTGLSVGLVLNFGGSSLIHGLRRVVNNLVPSPDSRLRINQRREAER
ncbi:MAG: GxxExxY protein [Gemmatimonadaceae bacterium]|nr:GxxExxY protein [Gemmatimonadaceae bacterium]